MTPIQNITPIQPGSTPQELLDSGGLYYLRDVFAVLHPEDEGMYKLAFKQIQRLLDQGRDTYEVMGRRKLGGRIAVDMRRFAPWYRRNPLFATRRLDDPPPFERFLERDAFYRLSEVCKAYPHEIGVTYQHLRRAAESAHDAYAEMGIVKADTTYVVYPPHLARWLAVKPLA